MVCFFHLYINKVVSLNEIRRLLTGNRFIAFLKGLALQKYTNSDIIFFLQNRYIFVVCCDYLQIKYIIDNLVLSSDRARPTNCSTDIGI